MFPIALLGVGLALASEVRASTRVTGFSTRALTEAPLGGAAVHVGVGSPIVRVEIGGSAGAAFSWDELGGEAAARAFGGVGARLGTPGRGLGASAGVLAGIAQGWRAATAAEDLLRGERGAYSTWTAPAAEWDAGLRLGGLVAGLRGSFDLREGPTGERAITFRAGPSFGFSVGERRARPVVPVEAGP